jgi:hypothetical protein
MKPSLAGFILLFISGFVLAEPIAGPTVTLDNGTFTGLTTGLVIQFLGIPFAQPPSVLYRSLEEGI